MATRKTAGTNARKATTKVVKQKMAPKPSAIAKPAVAATIRVDRGPVDAPGKRHRKPPPQESINKRMGEPTGKQMGQKSFKHGMQRGRG
jgi:hypothetical protein